MDSEASSAFQSFLSSYPEEVRVLARLARDRIREVMPDALEQLDPSANLIAYGSGTCYRELVFGIVIYPKYINLMFARGASLPNPQGLLTGTGKKARHIKIRQPSDLEQPGLCDLLAAAVDYG